MKQRVMITGATDGIGRATALALAGSGVDLILHGRNAARLEVLQEELQGMVAGIAVATVLADLSSLAQVRRLADEVLERFPGLDVLINNAGVFKLDQTTSPDGLDMRFAVNSVAPYLLTTALRPLFAAGGRVVNVASAAQAAVDLEALAGRAIVADYFQAYAQSKLALIMWTRHLARLDTEVTYLAVNPGSLLASKMVKEGFGVAGADLGIGASILLGAALGEEFAGHSGDYFDNDERRFADPHPAALDAAACAELLKVLDTIVASQRHSE
jgi:NAD(P)-dependent dehydrogenase (short-subunit alcohol dehydrogenase family)